MKLYLSSFKLGDHGQQLASMVGGNKRIGFIPNALDFATDLDRKQASIQGDLDAIKSIGLESELIDIQDFFGKHEALASKVADLDGLFVRGGNVFVLRVAMKLSGLDEILINKSSDPIFTYAGYSAGCCVLSPSLKGMDLVDNPNMPQTVYNQNTVWEGLNLVDFAFVPHYKSDHPESADIDKVVAYFQSNHIPFKTFKDGEVYIKE